VKKVAVLFILVLIMSAFLVSSVSGLSVVVGYSFKTMDNGMQGIWAVDHFHSLLTLTQTGPDCYNYIRVDAGTFETIGGGSPGGEPGDTVAAGIPGTVSGGISGTICGTLNINVPAGEEDLTVGSYASYEAKYFHNFFDVGTIYGFTITDWGWTFVTCGNGTWTDNEVTEADWQTDKTAMGDIVGEYVPCAIAPVPAVCTPVGAVVQPHTILTEGMFNIFWKIGGFTVEDADRQVIYTPPVYVDVQGEDGVMVYGQARGILILGCRENINAEALLPLIEAYGVYPDGVRPLNWGWYGVDDAIEFREPDQ